jgi:hypothetical protein
MLLPAVLLAATAPVAAAADIERRSVQFAKGASSATVKGTIEGDRTVDYLLRARAGQTMNVKLDTRHSALYFNVLPPGSDTALHVGSTDGNRWSGALPADGEYRVRTYLMRSAARRGESGAYTMTIGVTGAASGDAKVPGTRFNATGKVPCTLGSDPQKQCDFGVVRSGPGNAEVHVTLPGGFARVLRFSGATVGTEGKVKAEKRDDEWSIEVNDDEKYRIPDAVVNGG